MKNKCINWTAKGLAHTLICISVASLIAFFAMILCSVIQLVAAYMLMGEEWAFRHISIDSWSLTLNRIVCIIAFAVVIVLYVGYHLREEDDD